MNQPWIVLVFVFIFGLIIGSFLNVCIYRIPIGKTLVKGRSYCPHCDALIPWYLNIPLISFILLGGRCKFCRQPISWIYPFTELSTGLLFLAAFTVFGYTLEFLFVIVLFSVLVVLSLIDLQTQLIPDGLIYVLLGLGLMHGIYNSLVFGAPWLRWILGFFAVSLPLTLIGFILEESIGGGDIKLMAAAGIFLGTKLILLALFIGAIYAGVYSLALIFQKKAGMKTAIPFGPFLSLGIMTSVLVGQKLLNWYLAFFS